MKFKKGEPYHFDEVYAHCSYAVNSNVVCNNGYICSHLKCTEKCEDDDLIGKCYSFSCPLVSDTASRETILSSEDFDVKRVSFDEEGYTNDYEGIVVWYGE